MFAELPLWVLAIIVFICFSGYMAFRAMKAEHQLEQEFIEREGQVYMERIQQARSQQDPKTEQ